MKISFDDNGTLCIDAENNTEMMALKKWVEDEQQPLIRAREHLKTQTTVSVSPVS